MTTLRSLLFFLICLGPLIAHAGWLNFRGPQSSGYAPEISELPLELSDETLAWKVPLPGRGLGSAIVVGDQVFVTAASGPDQKQLHVLAFAAKDGTPLWDRRFWATGRTMAHKKTNVAAPTPVSDGERIYAFYSCNDVICLDLEGNLQWLRGLTQDYPNASNSLGMSSSPLIAGDTLVCQVENDSESFAIGLDLVTGINKWKLDRPKAANWTSATQLVIDGQAVVALQSSKGVLGVLPDTGSTVFNFDNGASTIPSSAAVGNRLYVPANGLTALELSTDGTPPKKIWSESNQRPGTPSPLVIDDRIYTINNA
ncbi:MAG: PQQ-binding-like beta-propeller repeat protein, partial [Verrucomicrobiota bacterium]